MKEFLKALPWMKIGVAALLASGMFGGGYITGSPPSAQPTTLQSREIVLEIPVKVFINGESVKPTEKKRK